MDISDRQNIELRMQIVDKYIRGNESYDGDFSNVINLLKDNVQVTIWDNMSVSEKNKKIESCIQYLEVEDEIKEQYGSNWDSLTQIDKKNIIKEKMDRNSNDTYEIKEINNSEDYEEDSSLLEI